MPTTSTSYGDTSKGSKILRSLQAKRMALDVKEKRQAGIAQEKAKIRAIKKELLRRKFAGPIAAGRKIGRVTVGTAKAVSAGAIAGTRGTFQAIEGIEDTFQEIGFIAKKSRAPKRGAKRKATRKRSQDPLGNLDFGFNF